MPGIELTHGAWRAWLLPEAGGLLAALECGGVPVLRGMADETGGPLDAACFPMVPWCNRIAAGRFMWQTNAVWLARNFMPEQHALHGHGWQSEWEVAAQLRETCILVHRHDGTVPGRWPWAYSARQAVQLSDEGCTITLSLTNHSERLMPAGLGLHPYLRRRPASRVAFRSGPIVAVGTDLIPTGAYLPPAQFADFAAEGGAALPQETIDHCYTGWHGAAVVRDDLGTITLTATGAGHLHLYAPADPAILCLEPVNHLPDAANTGRMGLIGPGETTSLTLRIGTGQSGG